MSKNLNSLFDNAERNFYFILLGTLISIFFTKPFLIYPYDVFTHLQWIDMQNHVEEIPKTRYIWHYAWARIFDVIQIDVTQIFLRARIIHYTQILITFFSLFYFSKVFIRQIFREIPSVKLNYLAYWSVLIWVTVLSTYSGYQQVWILWYSINYQITLPLTLLVTALSLSFMLESLSVKRKMIYFLLIILFSYIILRLHPMEYFYYLMYMGVLIIIYLDKIIFFMKKYIYFMIPIGLAFIFIFPTILSFIKSSAYRQSSILNYLSFEQLPALLEKIHTKGKLLVTYFNKSATTMNELIYLSLFLIIVMVLVVLYRYAKGYPAYVRIRMVIFLLITSFFVCIPLIELLGGIASVITYTRVVYRFYFSTLLFISLPVFIFYFFTIYKIKKIWILNLTIISILLSTFFYSQYFTKRQNYYKNIISIKNVFDKEKVGFNLSESEIETIGEKLKYYESLTINKKPEYYYARDDIAFVIKFIYRKPVMYFRRGSKNYVKSYTLHKNEKYFPILFEVPEGFPKYRRYK